MRLMKSARKSLKPAMLKVRKAEKEILKHALVLRAASDFGESVDGEQLAGLGDLNSAGAQDGQGDQDIADSSFKTGSALGAGATGEPQTPSATAMKAGDKGDETTNFEGDAPGGSPWTKTKSKSKKK